MGSESCNGGSLVQQLFTHDGQEASLTGVISRRPDRDAGLTVAARCSLAWPDRHKGNVDDAGKPVAWSHAGIVEKVHSSLRNWTPAERISGVGYAATASSRSVFIAADLAAKVPQNVSFEEAVFCVPGALAMQAVRLAGVKKGERVAVVGLPLVGRLACRILAMTGRRILVLDGERSRTDNEPMPDVYRAYPVEKDSVSKIIDDTEGVGVDAVIIAGSLESSELREIAGMICKEKGIVASVGCACQDLRCRVYSKRQMMFRRTSSFPQAQMQFAEGSRVWDLANEVSRPIERVDLQSFLELVSSGRLDVASLISHRFDISRAEEAYEILSHLQVAECSSVIFNYDRKDNRAKAKLALPEWSSMRSIRGPGISLGMIGVDDNDSTVEGAYIADEAGRSGFKVIRSQADNLITDPEIDSVYIANIGNRHGEWVVKSLLSGKATFVDGYLCMKEDELEQIEAARLATGAPLMVGYYRRFAPPAAKMRELIKDRRYPVSLHYRINGGPVVSTGLCQNPYDDRCPMLHEICNHVDLMSFLIGGKPIRIHAEALSMPDDRYRCDSNLQVMIRFSEGSVGTINYVSSGNSLAACEYLEILGDGKVIQLNDFRSLVIASNGKLRMNESKIRDTGRTRMLRLWHYYLVTGLGSPIPFDVIRDTSLACFRIIEALSEGNAARLAD